LHLTRRHQDYATAKVAHAHYLQFLEPNFDCSMEVPATVGPSMRSYRTGHSCTSSHHVDFRTETAKALPTSNYSPTASVGAGLSTTGLAGMADQST